MHASITKLLLSLGPLLWLGACSPSSPRPAPESPGAATERGGCPDAARASGAEAQYEEARAALAACPELCRKRSGGVAIERGLGLLREAAVAGHREAQALYGKQEFDFVLAFMDDADPRAEIAGVRSLGYLRLAARRGSPLAREYLPGIEGVSIDASGKFRPPLEPPLSAIPTAWVVRAIREADRKLACYR